MREVYNTYFDSENAPVVDDDLLEPQLRSCKSQMYTARRHNMPPLPETRDDINLEGQWGMTTVNQPFLQHQDDNMILLATDNLEMLASADTIYGWKLQDSSTTVYSTLHTSHHLHGVLYTCGLRTAERQVC